MCARRTAVLAAIATLIACHGEKRPAVAARDASAPVADAAPKPAARKPAAPWLASYDPAPVVARLDELASSPSLACVIGRAVRHHGNTETLDAVTYEAPPELVRAIGEGFARNAADETISAADWYMLAAIPLVYRGAIADARILFEKMGKDAEDGMLVEMLLAAGMPVTLGDDTYRETKIVRELAIAGRLDEANQRFARLDESDYKYDTPARAAMLYALGRDDELAALIASTPVDERWRLRVAVAETAVRTGRDLDGAIASLLAARKERGADFIQDAVALRDVAGLARGRGRGAELAPMRRALLDDLANAEPGLDTELLLAYLADEIQAVGGDQEQAALAATMSKQTMHVWQERVAFTHALHAGSLDEALAAAGPLAVDSEADYAYLRLWVRHAANGFDPGFDARLITAACPP